MGTRFGAERAEPEHGSEHRKMPLFLCSRFSGTRQSSVSIWTVTCISPLLAEADMPVPFVPALDLDDARGLHLSNMR